MTGASFQAIPPSRRMAWANLHATGRARAPGSATTQDQPDASQDTRFDTRQYAKDGRILHMKLSHRNPTSSCKTHHNGIYRGQPETPTSLQHLMVDIAIFR